MIKNAKKSAEAGDNKALQKFNQQIWQELSRLPDWAEHSLAAAETLPTSPGINSALKEWEEHRQARDKAISQGELPVALIEARKAWSVSRDKFGAKHVATLFTLREKATVLAELGRRAEAMADLNEAATGLAHTLSARHPEYLATRLELGRLRLEAGEWALAQEELNAVAKADLSLEGVSHALHWQAEVLRLKLFQLRGQSHAGVESGAPLCRSLRKAVGDFHEQVAFCLSSLAELAMDDAAFATATKALAEADTILPRLLPENDGLRVKNLLLSAEIKRLAGHPAEALAILQPLSEEKKHTSWPRNEIWRLFGLLSRAEMDMGHLEEANSRLNLLIATMAQTLGAEHPAVLPYRHDQAEVWYQMGRLRESRDGFAKLVEQMSRHFGPSHPTTLVAMSNLGLVLESLGDFDEAESWIRLTLEKTEATLGKQHPQTLAAINNLAMLLESQGRFNDAEPVYQRGLAMAYTLYGADHPDSAAVRNNLAYLYLLQKHLEKAEPIFAEIHEIWQKHLGESHPTTLKALNNLGRVQMTRGNLDKAEKNLTAALQGRLAHLGEHHLDTLRSRLDVASLRHAQGQSQEAVALLNAALTDSDRDLGPLHPLTFEIRNALAAILEQINRLPEALAHYQEGFERRTGFLDRMLWVADDNAREGYLRLHRPELDAYLNLLSHMPDNAAAGRGVIRVAMARKGLLLKVAAEQRQVATMAKDPQLAQLSQSLAEDRRQLARMTHAGPANLKEIKAFHANIDSLAERIQQTNRALGQNSLRFRQRSQEWAIDGLEAALEEGDGLVDFMVFHHQGVDKLAVGVTSKQNGKVGYGFVLLDDFNGIQKEIIALRGAILIQNQSVAELTKLARTLHDHLWKPLAPHLKKSSRIFIVPDDLLNILPFGALVDEAGNYLVATHSLRLLGSSRDLITPPPKAINSITILAGPDYDDNSLVPPLSTITKRGWSTELGAKLTDTAPNLWAMRAISEQLRNATFLPLPGMAEEGSLIENLSLGKKIASTALTGKEAQEAKLRHLFATQGILHLATHGFFLKADDGLKNRLLKMQRGGDQVSQKVPAGDNPLLRSGLVFAGINKTIKYLGFIDSQNDGLLTSQEVLELDLSGFQLAVLSACETGLGDIHEGEGVYGLRRSFQEAGIPLVLSSLWEVDDEGTMELMKEFYSRLFNGEAVAEAFQAAQRALMVSPKLQHPVIWSAFVLMGK